MKDGPYLLVVLFLVSVVLSVILAVAWKTLGRAPHARTWSMAFAVGALGYVANAIGAVLGLHSPAYVIAISTPTLIISYLGVRGYRQRARLPLYNGRFLAGFLLTEAIMFGANFILPHQGIRLAVVPFFSAIMLLLAARAAVLSGREPNTSDRTAAILQVVFACFELLLTALALRLGKGPNQPALMVYNQALLLGLPSCYIANGLIAVLILASDLARRMARLADTDMLTGLLNRRGFEREALGAILDARDTRTPLALVLADIDHFKRINDLHGHAIGDIALARFSTYLVSSLAASAAVGRLGGEEFVFLLTQPGDSETFLLVESLRTGVPQISFADLELEVPSFTVSFGVSFLEPSDAALADMLARADIALYQAKTTGRNRTCLFDPSMRPLDVARAVTPLPASPLPE
jgi:diguanylate cyclase (GGDEF)-like protein